MVYKNKAKDLKRAPLPSRAYKSARVDKRNARKRSRQYARNLTHRVIRDGYDEVEHLDPNWDNMDGYHGTRGIVRERRYADNLGALMSWAQALADRNPDAPADELRIKVRQIIGWDYMADHLMSHVENIDAFQINPTQYWWHGRLSLEERERYYADERKELIKKLTQYCQDLWLCGKNKELHKIANKCSSRRKIDGWERHTYTEPIYKFGYDHEVKRYRSKFTGEYKTEEYWIRRVLSYDMIPKVVEGWVRANNSSARAILK